MKTLLALFIVTPMSALADHRPEFQSLIDEPANMLDIAMLRLEDFIDWTKPNMAAEYHIAAGTDKQHHIDINADYREDDGVIHVSASLMDLQSAPEQMESGCGRVLNMLRINISKGLGDYFSHVDGSFTPSVSGQAANLFGMIKLSCYVYGRSSTDRRFAGVMTLEPGAAMELLRVD